MAEKDQAILAHVAMPAVRDTILSPKATLLFSEPGTLVTWANAAAAQLFGLPVQDLAGEPAWAGAAFQRQIRDAARQIDGEPVVRGFRVSLGGRHEFIQGALSRTRLPDGSTFLVFECTEERRIRRRREHELAEDTLKAFATQAAAILDEYGLPVAYTESFAAIDIAPEKLEALGASAGASRGLVREIVTDETGAAYSVDLVTLRDDPARHIVVISGHAAGAGTIDEAGHQTAGDEETVSLQGEDPADHATPVGTTVAAALAAGAGLVAMGDNAEAETSLEPVWDSEDAGQTRSDTAHMDGEESEPADRDQAAANAIDSKVRTGDAIAADEDTAAMSHSDAPALQADAGAGAAASSDAEAFEDGEWTVVEEPDEDAPLEWPVETLDDSDPRPEASPGAFTAAVAAEAAAAPDTEMPQEPRGAFHIEPREPETAATTGMPVDDARPHASGNVFAGAGSAAVVPGVAAAVAGGGSIRSLLERWYRKDATEDGGTAERPAPEPAAVDASVTRSLAEDAGWVADENASSEAAGVFDFDERPAPAETAGEEAGATEIAEPAAEQTYEDADARAAIESGASHAGWGEAAGGYEPAPADLDHTDDAVSQYDARPEQEVVSLAAGEPPSIAEEQDVDAAAWVEPESGDAVGPLPDPEPALPDDLYPQWRPEEGPASPAGDAPGAAAVGNQAETRPDEAPSDGTSGAIAAGAATFAGAASTWLTTGRGVQGDADAEATGGEPGGIEAPVFAAEEPRAVLAEHSASDGADTNRDEEPAGDLPAASFESAPAQHGEPIDTAAGGFVFESRPDPVRFAWTVDQDHVFRSVSPELAATLGPNAADVTGRNWADVARVFGFDRNGDIRRLLEKRDTWSGKTVLWPVQGTDLAVPVDLAALPAFSGARQFDGFRGFGIIRTADAVIDPDEIGLALVDGPFEPRDRDSAAALAVPAESHSAEGHADTKAEDDFALAMRQPDDSDPGEFANLPLPANVVELGAHKRDRGEELSSREARAFREIGQRLGGEEAAPAAETAAPEAETGHSPVSVAGLEQASLPLTAEPAPAAPEETVPEPHAPVAEEKATPEALLEDLPVPVLVYRAGETLYANPELLSITGHGSLEALIEAGGVDALFAGAGPSVGVDSAIRISRADGSRLEVRPVLRRVPWPGGRALLLAFRSPYQPEQADDRVAVDQARIEELKSILDTATDGIVITTPDGLVESLNGPAQALFGIAQESAAGKPLTELFAPESHRALSEYMREVAEPGIAGLLNDGREVIGREANGGLIPMFVTIGRAGDAGKYCAVLRDITHWKKAEEELVTARRAAETASEQKSEFLARVSHEIRTPLNAIIGFSDVMIEERFGPIDNERYRGYLRDINRSGVHVLDLINDLLDISKIEAGKMELTYEAVDLNLLVQETVALLQPQANSERIIIRTSLSRAVPRVVADARSIRQIILNLVSNAIKFTPANGQVIVSTVYEGNGEVVLRVRDTGRGMTEREIEHAMKPFHQINVTDERRGQGTGLGLPLTKALVEANRAYFDLESTPGEGTIAHVHFPTQRVLAD